MSITRTFGSEPAQFQVKASLSTYYTLADFSDAMSHIQQEITRIMNGERNDKGIIAGYLPSRMVADTLNVTNRPQPNCKHAEIDMRSSESSRVVRYGQCISGGAERRSYLDATLMTEWEFEAWKECSKATYTEGAMDSDDDADDEEDFSETESWEDESTDEESTDEESSDKQ
jgi:hypothetical protein